MTFGTFRDLIHKTPLLDERKKIASPSAVQSATLFPWTYVRRAPQPLASPKAFRASSGNGVLDRKLRTGSWLVCVIRKISCLQSRHLASTKLIKLWRALALAGEKVLEHGIPWGIPAEALWDAGFQRNLPGCGIISFGGLVTEDACE